MGSEPGSFEEFFRQQFTRVVGSLMHMGFDSEEARDATSEAMLRAYRRWSTLTQPRPWVFTTAYRVAANKARRDRDGFERAIAAGWGVSRSTDPCAAVDDRLEVVTVLSVLPPKQRLVMVWHLYDISPKDIARQLDISQAAVRSHLRHARDRLRKHFEAARLEGREVIDDVE